MARELLADDALLVAEDGRILEASRASFFYATGDGQLYTPPLSYGILDSITRRDLISATKALEHPTMVSDVASFSEAFLASTTKEVLPVRSIDGQELPLVPGPLSGRGPRMP